MVIYVKGVHSIIANTLSRVHHQDSTMPENIETCFLMETEHFPLAFTIIAQAQEEDSHIQQTLLQTKIS